MSPVAVPKQAACSCCIATRALLFRRDSVRGTLNAAVAYTAAKFKRRSTDMDGLIYLVGLIVVIMAILSFFGLR